MPTKGNTKVIVLSIGLAIVMGVAILVCVVVLPVALQARREAARREQAANNLRQIGEALEQFRKGGAKPPAFVHEAKLPFDTYSGYFVSNQFEPNAPESFVVISDQEQFDRVFGVAMVMDDKSHRLPEDAFKSLIVVAAIKRGRAVIEYEVEDVTVTGGMAQLRYTATSKKSDAAAFASPLIVSIPKDEYTAMQFIENKKPVRIEMGTGVVE